MKDTTTSSDGTPSSEEASNHPSPSTASADTGGGATLPAAVTAAYTLPGAGRARVWLASAGTAANRFAICGPDHIALWYGNFDPSDADHPAGDPDRAELAAAQRAIWLAGHARGSTAALPAPQALLQLTVAAALDEGVLQQAAAGAGLALEVEVDPANPALSWCAWRGQRRWRSGAVAALAGGGKPSPDDVVTARESELRDATTHGQVYSIAAQHGVNTRRLFPIFKRVLRVRLGLDYDQLRAATEAARHAEAADLATAAASGPHITLSAAADPDGGRYAICGPGGQPVWYGQLRSDDTGPGASDAATDAARKAVWLAGQARTAAGAGGATLHLTISQPDLDMAGLEAAAASVRLLLDVTVAEIDNPAIAWCTEQGWLHYRRTPLADLLTPPI